jgi:hypothetical protein
MNETTDYCIDCSSLTFIVEQSLQLQDSFHNNLLTAVVQYISTQKNKLVLTNTDIFELLILVDYTK